MSNINDYIKPTDYGHVRKDINKILSLIHDFVAQNPEDLGNKERIMFTPHVKLRTSNVTVGGATWSETDTLNRETWNWRRKKPASVDTYNLIHTQVGAGALTFPVSDTWYGARCDADGTNYITIDDHTDMDGTTEISISAHLRLPASGGGFVVAEKQDEWRLRVIDTNILEWSVYSGGAYKTPVTYTYTPDTKFVVTCTYKSTSSGQKIYINGTLSDSDSETGAINNSTNKVGIFARGDGTSIALVNTRIAAFNWISKEATTGWVTNYNNGMLDTSDGFDEVTTILFTGDDSPTPNAEAGLFKAA